VRCPLWQEDRSAICSVITHWSESRRTRNYTLLPHLRLPQPGGPGFRIYTYIPPQQGGPVILSGTGFPLRCLLRLAGLRSRSRSYFTTDSQSVCLGIEHEVEVTLRLTVSQYVLVSSRSRSYFTTDSQSVCLGIEYPCGTCDQILFPVRMLLSEIWGLVYIGRPLWREDRLMLMSLYDWQSVSQSVSQYVLVSSTHMGLAIRYYFLSECCCLKFAFSL
jgi:hypothetical protein